MKKTQKIFLVLFSVILLFSCSKKEEKMSAEAGFEALDGQTGADDADISADKRASKTADTSASVTAVSGVEGVVYVNEAALYTETDEGKMKWAAAASLGSKAVYLGESKEAVRTDGQKRTFYHINLKGKDCWIQDYSFEPDTVSAFISAQDTVLYKSESLTAATDEIIPQYAVIAVYNESLQNDNSKFVKIAAYNTELLTWIVKEKFVKRDAVELGETNVEAMLLAQVAMTSQNDTIRKELFQNAVQLGSDYSDDIAVLQSLAEVLVKEEKFLKNLQTEKIETKVTVKDDTDLLSVPDALNARILNTLKADSSATAYRKTESDGSEWFYIQNRQKKGWVQASALTFKEK